MTNENFDCKFPDDLRSSRNEKQLKIEDIDAEILDTFLKVRALRKCMLNTLLGDSWTSGPPIAG
jgi:hypothetical protein